MDSILLAPATATITKWEVQLIELKNAFLQGDLEEEIYMDKTEW